MNKNRLIGSRAVFEFLAFWRGGVTATELGRTLGLTREAVQRSIVGPYKKDFPGTMVRRKERTYFDGDASSLKISPWRVMDAMNFTCALQAFAEAAGEESPLGVPVEDVANPLDVDNDVERFRALYAALARKHSIYIDYAAKRGRLQLIFSPHAIVRTAARIHVRGHSVRLGKYGSRYIDIVPGRIISMRPGLDEDYVGVKGDIEWRTRVSIVAELNPHLSKTARASVMQEHQCGTELRIEGIRQAVAEYVIDWLKGRRLRKISEPIWTKVEIEF